MNINKALRNLYHAVSGETTNKTNISKLLVDIHYAITGEESTNKNNWSKIIDSMATNWPETWGNPNSTDSHSGTVAEPFDGFVLADLHDAISSGNANANMWIDASALGQSDVSGALYVSDSSPYIFMTGADANLDAFYIAWDSTGTLTDCKMSISGTVTDLTPYASLLGTNINVFYHPMS